MISYSFINTIHLSDVNITARIILDDNIDPKSLETLFEHGKLDSRCQGRYQPWKEAKKAWMSNIEQEKMAIRAQGLDSLNADINRITKAFPFYLVRESIKTYPLVFLISQSLISLT